jgi:hypothetical protein
MTSMAKNIVPIVSELSVGTAAGAGAEYYKWGERVGLNRNPEVPKRLVQGNLLVGARFALAND